MRPSLRRVPGRRGAVGDLAVSGDFTVLQQFSISPVEGKAFVEASEDSNPIHTQDTVVPGAMTAARFLLLPEILIPGLTVKSVRVKFRAFAHYDRSTVNVYQFRRKDDRELTVQLKSYQRGNLVAEASLGARLRAPGLSGEGTEASSGGGTSGPSASQRDDGGSPPGTGVAGGAPAEIIRTFLRSLRVEPDPFLSEMGFGYPRAFLASLPSGEMVRLGGAGGLLNILDLQFPVPAVPAIDRDPPPRAEVEPKRPRNNFRRVLARVGSGIQTYCKGYATVLAAVVLSSGQTA